MAYTNKISAAAAVATAMLFLTITITEAQQTPPMPKVDPVCRLEIPDIVQNCYSTLSALPSEECCKGLKSASSTQVTCLCDNFIAHPIYGNISRPFYNQINSGCGVLEKYACDGTSKGKDSNGGTTNKITASMGLFGLVASLFI